MSDGEAELRALLRAADASVRVPPGLADRVRAVDAAERRRRAAWRTLVAGMAAATVAGGIFLAGYLAGHRAAERPPALAPAAPAPHVLTVYNADPACWKARPAGCAVSIKDVPHTRDGAVLARVWHGDDVQGVCAALGDLAADESGVASTRWYRVTARGVTGWLPAARTRTVADLPACPLP
ncbi:hypothetical protein [Actinomadura parmotrematis]|uniref:SH3 domain-containing protein n=1 Tax=Actinomadura parmotrematis TaxID=2864039 RepID=A0ABS7G187_9ACTN|nr:hypothetical protein [Actinomadura parmotrematis]MBW8486437.1 hypothetical protein [Actinomadura parmotrematis]